MSKEFKVAINKFLKKRVSVEAETRREAEEIVAERWYEDEYSFDEHNYYGVEFEAEGDPTMKDMSYEELSSLFRSINEYHLPHVDAYVVFSSELIDKVFPESLRTFVFSSNNKAFRSDVRENAIFANYLLWDERMVRLDRLLQIKELSIQRCYMDCDEYELAQRRIEEEKTREPRLHRRIFQP